MNRIQYAAVLAGRLSLAWIFLLEGVEKLGNYAAVGGYMEAHGVPSALLPLVILTELVAGALIALGWFTRLAAMALGGFCLLTAAFFHTDFADPNQVIHFNKNIAIAGGFLYLAAFGGGAWSVDALRGRTKPTPSAPPRTREAAAPAVPNGRSTGGV